MASRLLPAIIVALLALALLAPVLPASADTPTPTDTATVTETPTPTSTATPTPTGTPAYVAAYTLDSGNTLIVERHWTFGELGIFLAIVANMALTGVHWIYEVTRREAR